MVEWQLSTKLSTKRLPGPKSGNRWELNISLSLCVSYVCGGSGSGGGGGGGAGSEFVCT